jgi:hypothetical protein
LTEFLFCKRHTAYNLNFSRDNYVSPESQAILGYAIMAFADITFLPDLFTGFTNQ